MEGSGAFSDQMIKSLLNGYIDGSIRTNVKPASLDLSLSGVVFQVKGSFLPAHDETVMQSIRRAGGRPIFGKLLHLKKGYSYVAQLNEEVTRLPDRVYAYANPKSSTGRLFVHVRVLVDKFAGCDTIPKNYTGSLWLLISPKTFSVEVESGLSLAQMRFFNRDTRLGPLAIDFELNSTARSGVLFSRAGDRLGSENLNRYDGDGSLVLSLGLNFEHPGFEALQTSEPINMSLLKHYEPRRFFREIEAKNGSITLRSGSSYILSSAEYVAVPPDLACEMKPMDTRSGDFRAHYAGFIDPGWGIKSGRGRPLTLEVRSFEHKLIVKHGQPVAKIKYEQMIEEPDKHYDNLGPNYGEQSGPQLSKHFTKWK